MLAKLFACFIGVFVFFLLNGIAMETLTKTFGKQISTFYVFMVLIPSLFSGVFAKMIITLQTHFSEVNHLKKENNEKSEEVPKSLYFLCSIFMMASMLCSNAALGFITFPTQLILKSVKPLSVLFCAICAAKKNYSIYRLISTLIIVFGVTLFMYEQYKFKTGSRVNSMDAPLYVLGWILVLASLVFDGLLAATQERLRLSYHLNTYTLMYYINTYTSLMLTVIVIATGELIKFISFMSGKSSKIIYLFFLGSCSAAGQLFVYYTIITFGPLSCSIITTIRKFFSVLFSVLLFSHWMSFEMWTCVVLVFVGLSVDIYAQYKGKAK